MSRDCKELWRPLEPRATHGLDLALPASGSASEDRLRRGCHDRESPQPTKQVVADQMHLVILTLDNANADQTSRHTLMRAYPGLLHE
jgi:hypothetical protein